jgi:ectoine hydroxylase
MYTLKHDQLEQFQRDGYVLIERLFDSDEVDLLLRIAKADQQIMQRALERRDGSSGVSKLWLTDQLGEDVFSAVVRCHRVVDTMEQLLGGEVYHYHHKVMLKEPLVGGAWEWHQDYGYWYSNFCLFPYMGSCLIALDPATIANGCLQVIKGSHHLGRVDHGKTGDQTGADIERVNEALKYLEVVHCEMNPGTALFFHCNLLHRSDANRSPNPRWSLICCYNAARNPCRGRPNHPSYHPLEKWPDSRIKECGMRQLHELKPEASRAV